MADALHPGLRRYRGPALALALGLLTILFQYQRHRDEVSRFNRFELPAFDPYVYVAMAEQPRYFTVAPWGYRILTPWVVHALPFRNAVRSFRVVTVVTLSVSGLLLYLFLRRVGHGEWASLVAVAALGISSPVGECVQSLFVTEPLSLFLEIAFLLAVAAGSGLAVLTLLAVLLAFSKEIWLLFLPLVYFSYRDAGRGGGRSRAVGAALLVGIPALVATLGVRLWWAPHIRPPHAPLNLESLGVALEALRGAWGDTWPALLLAGLTPVAMAGAAVRRARPFARRYGYLALATIALALVAWINIPAPMAIPLYGSNTMRLMVYALPLLLPLALFGLDRLWPHWQVPRPPRQLPRVVSMAAAVLAVAAVASPFVVLDRYRRLPLHQYRDGPLVLTLCRESLRTARRLDLGRETVWSLADSPVRVPADRASDPSWIRWYLREGWGSHAHSGSGEAVMHSSEATLLLPCLTPRDLEVTLTLSAPAVTSVSVRIGSQLVGQGMVGPDGEPLRVRIPGTLLFRGDNLLTLSSGAALRLRAVSYRPIA